MTGTANGTTTPLITPDWKVTGATIVLWLVDVGDEVQLGRVRELLGAERAGLRGTEQAAIRIPNPPVTVEIGDLVAETRVGPVTLRLSARIFDFGTVSLRLHAVGDPEEPWAVWAARAGAVEQWRRGAGQALLEARVRELAARIRSAIVRPRRAKVTEDYVFHRLYRLTDASGEPVVASTLGDEPIAALLLDESRPLTARTRADLLPHRFSYYLDDLTVLAWEGALVLDPEPGETDVEYVLEFANAQLLQLRVYDELLGDEVAAMYDQVELVRRQWWRPRRWGGILADVQETVAEATEVVERVENALKLTDDVYLARVYTAALDVFRGRAWRASVDRQLGVMRETYGMLNDGATAGRAEFLEATIVALILFDIIMGFL